MPRRCLALAISMIFVLLSSTRADEKPPTGGTLSVGGRTYQLTKFAAYETGEDDDTLVTVWASDRNLPLDRMKKSLSENDGSDERISLSQPYLKIVYRKSGEIQFCQAWADNASFSANGQGLAGQVKLVDARVQGQAIYKPESDNGSPRGFSVLFDAPLGLDAAPAKTKLSGPVKPSVTGKFTGNGKPAKLAHVSAQWTEPFSDKPALRLILTEQPHAQAKRPDIKAGFGDYGSALIISMNDDGSVFGCEVAHAAHTKKPFSSIGKLRLSEFDLGEGFVSGHLSTDGEDDTFGQKWEVDLKFTSPLTGQPPRAAEEKPASQASTKKKPSKSAPQPPAEPKPTGLSVRDLPLPKDATDLQYNAVVEQLTFKSPAKVVALAKDLSKGLAEQGWAGQAGDLVTPNSSILSRVRGEATLTIMLKPAGTGSAAQVFATGLEWDEKEK